jgi:hypothetical protein
MRRLSFWVGSVWNNKENQGNIKVINELREALRKRNVFLAISHANNSLARRLIRYSRIAPAVAGSWQVENNYLPCRMFKNVSYGALGLTNVKGFEGIFGDSLLYSSEIEGLVEMGFSMPDKRKRAYVAEQQERVAHHTYANKLKRIIDSFEMLNDG